MEVTAPHLSATVPDLDANTEYEFRVRAVNEAGPSEASKPSKSVITKPRKCMSHRFYNMPILIDIIYIIVYLIRSGA